jgi:hypothetical protein|tara:strand:+ start:1119 stop:1379 length:261 start_codon:yes stop_codon:yes gene_type:complete
MSREFLRFSHANPPPDPQELPSYLNETFNELGAVVELLRDGHLDVVYAAPTKPSQGDIRYADGTSWNPGSGEGIYFFNSASAWVKL